MMPDNSFTNVAAWWGAIIATLVFLWDMYKWRKSGPDVVVFARPNMQTSSGANLNLRGKYYVLIEAVNMGNKKTTITHLIGCHYSSLLERLFKEPSRNFFIANTGLSQTLPYVLEPGERWLGIIDQNSDLEEMGRNGYLYCGVNHSLKTKPVLRRVKFNKTDITNASTGRLSAAGDA